jgi:hypothetical protein
MDVCEPRLRHRGFFLHSSEAESDSGEHENPEGFAVRVRTPGHQMSRKSASARRGASGARFGGRSHRTDPLASEGQPEIRSGSVTGSRQRAHLPR